MNLDRKNLLKNIAFYGSFLLILSFIFKLYFTPGHTYFLDGSPHAVKVQFVYESLKAGEFPLWNTRNSAGMPDIQFYSPLYFYITGAISLLFNDFLFSIKLVCFLAHILSGLTALWLVQEVTGNRRAGYLGGLVYALAPWHLYHILDFFRLPVSMVYTFMPLPVLFFERYRNGKSSFFSGAVSVGLSLGLLVCVHQGYTLFFTFIFTIYVLLSALKRQKPYINLNILLLLALAGVICFLSSAWYVIPFISETKLVARTMGSFLASTGKFNTDSATWEALITRRATPVFHKGYLGASFFYLALLGVIYAILKKRYYLIAIYLFSIYIVLGYDTYLYQFLPLVYSQTATYRMIMYWILFMAILAGGGYTLIEDRLVKAKCYNWIIYLVFATLAGIFIFDGSVVMNRQWPRSHGMEPVYASVRQAAADDKLGGRSMQICDQKEAEWMFALTFPCIMIMETPTPVLWGPAMSLRSDPFVVKGIEWARQELQDPRGLNNSYKFLYLLNVSQLVYLTPQGGINILKPPLHSPVFASGGIEYLNGNPDPASLSYILDGMGIDFRQNTARKIYLMPEASGSPANWTAGSDGGDVKLTVLDYHMTPNQTFLNLETNRNCFLHISQAFYEILRVYVDDKPVDFKCTATGLIAIQFPEGKHRVRISPYYSDLRTLSLWFSLGFILLMLGMLIVKGKE